MSSKELQKLTSNCCKTIQEAKDLFEILKGQQCNGTVKPAQAVKSEPAEVWPSRCGLGGHETRLVAAPLSLVGFYMWAPLKVLLLAVDLGVAML